MFLEILQHFIDVGVLLKAVGNVNSLRKDLLREAKVYGFTYFQIARAVGLETELKSMSKAGLVVRTLRTNYGILPVVSITPDGFSSSMISITRSKLSSLK